MKTFMSQNGVKQKVFPFFQRGPLCFYERPTSVPVSGSSVKTRWPNEVKDACIGKCFSASAQFCPASTYVLVACSQNNTFTVALELGTLGILNAMTASTCVCICMCVMCVLESTCLHSHRIMQQNYLVWLMEIVTENCCRRWFWRRLYTLSESPE